MTPEDGVDLDPEVLADPLPEEEQDGPREDETTTPATVIVPDESQSLVPADPFQRYMAEVRKYPPLNREEERELAIRYRETGDREALFRLITANLMMVVRIAQSFRRAARNLLDLIQEGNLGLLQAIERFDPDVGARLPTYAAWWVRAYMVKFLLDNVRLVRVGTTNARRKLLRNLRQEKAKLEEQGYEVGPKLLAAHFDVSEQDVKDVEQALHSHDVSIDAPVTDSEGEPRPVVLPDQGPDVEESVARQELQERVQEAIGRFRRDLGERERAILDRRLLAEEPQTLQELGNRFGTTREAVRQAEARLKKRLTEFLQQELGDVARVFSGPA